MIQRIDKLIASQGGYSRKEVKKLIRDGAIRINGRTVAAPEDKVDDECCEIEISGKTCVCKRNIYIMLNKPSGVVSASRDTKQKTVVELVPPELKREGLFPAGRLDGDTTGFVLITDDGDFAHKLLAPKSHVDKVYIAELAESLDSETVEAFRNGVRLADGTLCLQAECEALSKDGITVRIVLHEGKYHQIKRMFAACGNAVVSLTRTQIGSVTLDSSLLPGECREMTSEEVTLLRLDSER